jgi:hypothetical protein
MAPRRALGSRPIPFKLEFGTNVERRLICLVPAPLDWRTRLIFDRPSQPRSAHALLVGLSAGREARWRKNGVCHSGGSRSCVSWRSAQNQRLRCVEDAWHSAKCATTTGARSGSRCTGLYKAGSVEVQVPPHTPIISNQPETGELDRYAAWVSRILRSISNGRYSI